MKHQELFKLDLCKEARVSPPGGAGRRVAHQPWYLNSYGQRVWREPACVLLELGNGAV